MNKAAAILEGGSEQNWSDGYTSSRLGRQWMFSILSAGILLAGLLISMPSHAGDAAWPFDQPSLSVLRQSPKKVFAHYFPPFPISMDNKAPATDYYTAQYLNPAGESYKHLYCGGYIRERPLPQAPVADTQWQLRNLEKEVRRAVAIGLDGFTVDIITNSGTQWTTINLLMQAAANVDPGFKIILMPDMNATIFETTTAAQALTSVITTLSKYKSAYRLADGRLVVSAYNAQKQPVSWWSAWLSQMSKKQRVNIAFVPLFQGWQLYENDFKSISYGYTDWGVHSALGQYNPGWVNAATEAHQFVPVWMAPVTPQDMRPWQMKYWEGIDSVMYRKMWMNAIQGGADWVHVITWNDYSETTGISPSTGTQYSYYDLTAFYITWFKTGVMPAITRDVLYYFHRTHAVSAQPNTNFQSWGPFQFQADGTNGIPVDFIEVLAFLTAPGTVSVTVGAVTTSQDVPAGGGEVFVPLQEGTPEFTLLRNGNPVIDFNSAFPISNSIWVQNLHYRGGSSSRPPIPALSVK